MNEPRPFASLSPTLLARKGGARPAMRPQMHPQPVEVALEEPAASVQTEDLGWNDMGEAPEPTPYQGAEIVSLIPEVVRQQRAIAQRVNADQPRRSALDDGRRAAFTLRLDAERHLKLRLACTVRNRSAQQLLTEALDQLIDGLPEIETLAAQVARRR